MHVQVGSSSTSSSTVSNPFRSEFKKVPTSTRYGEPELAGSQPPMLAAETKVKLFTVALDSYLDQACWYASVSDRNRSLKTRLL